MVPMTSAILVPSIVFLVALLVWARARRRILQSGVPDGRVVYQDTDRRRALERPLVSRRYGLTGKPDYLVEARDDLIPVELKSRGSTRYGPNASEVAQLTAYCVLVEDSLGATPPHGIIQYADRSWPIRYTRKGRERILQILDEMRRARQAQTVHRDHENVGHCRACGYRTVCDEALD
jgi:CRISPR-associated exonuclease Cas4